MQDAVGECWVINPDARNVPRWRGHDHPGDVLSKHILWHPDGIPTFFVIELPRFFHSAYS